MQNFLKTLTFSVKSWASRKTILYQHIKTQNFHFFSTSNILQSICYFHQICFNYKYKKVLHYEIHILPTSPLIFYFHIPSIQSPIFIYFNHLKPYTKLKQKPQPYNLFSSSSFWKMSSKQNVRRHALEKHREKEKTRSNTTNVLLSKHWKKIYPIGLHKTGSSLSLSSLSLSLSQTSNDSSLTDSSSITPLDQKISLALRLIASSSSEKREIPAMKNVVRAVSPTRNNPSEEELMRRCNWITSSSGKLIQLSFPLFFITFLEILLLFKYVCLYGDRLK